MDQIIVDVASRVKELRELNGFSVEYMASMTKLSNEEYLAFENGEKDFAFTFIYKCASLFHVDVSDLMQGSSPKLTTYSIIRKGGGVPIARKEGFNYLNVAPHFKNKLGEPFYVTIPYVKGDEFKPIHLNVHTGQETSIILKGSVLAQFGNNIETLYPGDVIYFDSRTPHGMVAVGGEDCEFFTLIINDPSEEGENLPLPVENEPDAIKKDTSGKGLVWSSFVDTKINSKGELKKIKFKNEDNFNFAYDVVDKLGETKPEKECMIYVDKNHGERRFSYKDMSLLSSKAANYFRSLGIQKGDKVMLVLKRHYQFWISILALHKLGAVAIPATSQLVKKDFVYRFRSAGICAIVCTPDDGVPEQIELAAAECPLMQTKIIVNEKRDGWHFFDEELESFSDSFLRPQGYAASRGDDVMLMFFTSGTSGYPKIASHSHKYALGHFVTAKYWHSIRPTDLHFTISDTGWGKALWGKLYGAWLCEACVFVYDFDRFNANDILPMFKKYNITTFCAPPTMYRFFVKEDLSRFDLSSIRYATTAGEALNAEVYNKFMEHTGLKIMEGFGQTETTLVIANLYGSENKPGSMGKPNPLYKVELLARDGSICSVGQTGEICIKTDESTPCGLFRGYYRDDEKTAAVWHDGYYHTGDTAWKDEDGYYWYVGRVDDLIKSSGYRIGPFEIESVIMELPYVLECAVTAAPDEIRGQVVKATIVLTKGSVGTDELKKEIQVYVKEHTAPYKYPRIVEFVEELPKTFNGKIRRADLR